jgi:hypothetical protein
MVWIRNMEIFGTRLKIGVVRLILCNFRSSILGAIITRIRVKIDSETERNKNRKINKKIGKDKITEIYMLIQNAMFSSRSQIGMSNGFKTEN